MRRQVLGHELLGLPAGQLLRELDDEQLVGAGLLDQLHAAVEGRQELHVVAEHEAWMGLERQHRRPEPGRLRRLDHRSVAEVDAVERAERDRPPGRLELGRGPGDDHGASSGSSRNAGTGEGRSQSAPARAPTVATHRVGRTPIASPERTARERAERTDPPVDEVERPRRPRAKAVGREREHDRADVDVENHDAHSRAGTRRRRAFR